MSRKVEGEESEIGTICKVSEVLRKLHEDNLQRIEDGGK
jgi:hypothetical protein